MDTNLATAIKQIHDTPVGQITEVKLINARGAWVTLSSLGAGIVSVVVPDRDGNFVDVALGYKNLADYMADGPCCGKTPGRYANRIASGRFSIDGREYQLAVNNGPNALHGGPTGFQNHIWNVVDVEPGKVIFGLVSPDGDEGYPGTFEVLATYTWDDDNRLTIKYQGKTDAPTVVNLTNHTYWNLNGEGHGDILDHILEINALDYLVTDETLVPIEPAPVEGTPMDFRKPRVIGSRINEPFPALIYGKGYDNCWPIDRTDPARPDFAASLYSPVTGIVLTVKTNQPAVQVYTGNWLDGCPEGKSGVYHDYDGVAIECQGYPNAPNAAWAPSTLLRPGDSYSRFIKFEFSTAKTDT